MQVHQLEGLLRPLRNVRSLHIGWHTVTYDGGSGSTEVPDSMTLFLTEVFESGDKNLLSNLESLRICFEPHGVVEDPTYLRNLLKACHAKYSLAPMFYFNVDVAFCSDGLTCETVVVQVLREDAEIAKYNTPNFSIAINHCTSVDSNWGITVVPGASLQLLLCSCSIIRGRMQRST